MNNNFQDPFYSLLQNGKVDKEFWKAKAGSPSYGLQDDAVIALRKMGYDGTVTDMLRSFYSELSGKSYLMEAWATVINRPDTLNEIDYVGKVRGDGDSTRQIYYGALGELAHPDGLSEAGSAMAGVSYANDGNTAYYSITNPVGYKAQLIFHINLSDYGTKSELIKKVKKLEVYQNTLLADTYFFNNTKGVWVKHIDNSEAKTQTIDITQYMEDYVANTGEIYIGYLAPTATDGVTASRVEVDYFKTSVTLI